MWLNPEFDEIKWIPRPSDDEITAALLGIPAEQLPSLREFCITPRTRDQIKDRFLPCGLVLSQLFKLGMLSETEKIGTRKGYMWAGWDAEKLNAFLSAKIARSKRDVLKKMGHL